MQKNKKDDDERVFNILVIDDEKEYLVALRRILEHNKRFKSQIKTVESGEEALDKLKEQKFDVVLSDYRMPKMTGVELLTKVKDRYPNTLRMLITGYTDITTAKEAINKAEVNNYIEKTWDSKEIVLTIDEALKRKVEREAVKKEEANSVPKALKLVHQLQKDVSNISQGKIITEMPKLRCEFNSVQDFNKFSYELKKMGNISIDDIYVFENKYIITISVHPRTVRSDR